MIRATYLSIWKQRSYGVNVKFKVAQYSVRLLYKYICIALFKTFHSIKSIQLTNNLTYK